MLNAALASCSAFAPRRSSATPEDRTPAKQDPNVSITPRSRPSRTAEANRRPANIRVDTTLVLINVTVTTPLNQVVTGLEAEHFQLFEDKIEQNVSEFSSEDAPLSVGLVFDISGSMGAKLHKSRQAAAQFFKTANPEMSSS